MRQTIATLCLAALTLSGASQAEPIPDDVLFRVFKIGVRDKQGTCFAVDFATAVKWELGNRMPGDAGRARSPRAASLLGGYVRRLRA